VFVENLVELRVERVRGAPRRVLRGHPDGRLLWTPSSFAIAIGGV
jgi:hypothetical protein